MTTHTQSTEPLTAESPEIRAFLSKWHEEGRAAFERSYDNLDYDGPTYAKTATDRRKYIALDAGRSGAFLLDKTTRLVYRIKAYGVPNKRKCLGTIDTILVCNDANLARLRWW